MKRLIVAAALVAFAIPVLADELVVTAREAGVIASTETGVAPATAPAVAPREGDGGVTKKFYIVAAITVGDKVVGRTLYSHPPFADEAACKAFVAEDDGLKGSNARLSAFVAAKFNPDAKVGVSCEPDSER